MRRILIFTLILLYAAVSAPLNAEEVDISGKWKMTIILTDGREIDTKISINQEGSKITVNRIRKNGEVIECKGTVEGNEITWTEIGIVNGTEVEFVHTGKVTGDKMKGEIDSMGGIMEFSAQKIKNE